jgi:hypothetical protein
LEKTGRHNLGNLGFT